MSACLSLVDEPASYHKPTLADELKFPCNSEPANGEEEEEDINGDTNTHLPGHLRESQRETEHQDTKTHCKYHCGFTDNKTSVAKHEEKSCPMRPYNCQYCQYQNNYKDVTELHQRTCLRFPVQCPYSCGAKMTRYDLVSHIEKDCTLVPVECQFSWAGCNESSLTRSQLTTHSQTHQAQHLSLLAEACSSLSKDNKELKDKHKELEKSNAELLLMCSQLYSAVTGNLPSLPIKLSFSNQDELEKSDYFYSSRFGYKMSITYSRSPMITADNCLKERDVMFDKLELTIHNGVFDNQLEWPFKQNVTIGCIIRHNNTSQCLKLILSHEDSSHPQTLFLSPLPLLDPEEDRERFIVHVVYTGDMRPWYCESVEVLSVK